MKKKIIAAVGAAAVAALAAGCTHASVSQTPIPAPAQNSHSPATAPNTGAIGTTYTIHDSDNGTVYTVTLVKFVSSAEPDTSFDAADAQHYLAGAEFKITGVSGTTTDDADNNSSVIGHDNQTYPSVSNRLADGTDFNSGQFTVAPGQTSVGWVTFQLPDSVTTSKQVVWSPDSGIGGAQVSWIVGPS